jgi:hypothetical protein
MVVYWLRVRDGVVVGKGTTNTLEAFGLLLGLSPEYSSVTAEAYHAAVIGDPAPTISDISHSSDNP